MKQVLLPHVGNGFVCVERERERVRFTKKG